MRSQDILAFTRPLRKSVNDIFWPGYEQDIRTAVVKCEQCQRRNQPVPKSQAPLGTINADYPFQTVMGYYGSFAYKHEGKKIHSSGDSKWVEAFPLVKTDSITLAKVLTDEIVCRYGAPKVMHGDKGSNLVSESLCDQLWVSNALKRLLITHKEMAK